MEQLLHFYKMCHGYTHGNVGYAIYPVLHYFEISIMLFSTVANAYCLLCEEMGIDSAINGVDVIAKATEAYNLLCEQYAKRTTQLFERHYQKR